MNRRFFQKGARDGIPIALGYLAVSFSFGIVARGAGLTAFGATLMSLTNVTSAGQFAGVTLIAAAAPYLEVAITQLVINLRYSLMSAALSQKLEPGTGLRHRFIMAFGITDEIFGVSSAVPGRLNPFYTYGQMAVAIPGWALGTLLGAAMGGVLPARLLSALGVALYGMFIAIVIPPARQSRVLAGLVALSMLASCVFTFAPLVSGISSGFRIILLTLLIAGGAAYLFPVKNGGQAQGADGAQSATGREGKA